MESGSFMLQFSFEVIWSFGQWVGMLITFPIVFLFWFKKRISKNWTPENFEGTDADVILVRLIKTVFVFLMTPFLAGITLAMIMGIGYYPELAVEILYKGSRHYFVGFGAAVLILIGERVYYWRKRKSREVSEDLSLTKPSRDAL